MQFAITEMIDQYIPWSYGNLLLLGVGAGVLESKLNQPRRESSKTDQTPGLQRNYIYTCTIHMYGLCTYDL